MIKGINPRLAEAGKIKIGGLGPERKTKSGKKWRPPVKLDHFLITKTTRDRAGDLEVDKDLMAALETDGDGKVRAIPIVLHSDDIDEVFPSAYALYSGRRCACRGDGERATKHEIQNGKHTGVTKEVGCPCDYLGSLDGPKCKPNGKLHCSIAVRGAAIAGALHIWRTTSIISVERMIGSLQQIRAICGTLRGVPLWLRVEPVRVEPPNAPAATVYCCHVELRASDIEAVQRQALEAARLRRELSGPDDYRALLAPPADDSEPEDEQAAVAAEFYADDQTNRAELPMAKEADVETVKEPVPTQEPEPEKPKPTTNDTLKGMVGAQNASKKAPKEKPKGKSKAKPQKAPEQPPEPPPLEDDDEVDYGGPEGELF